MRPTRIGTLVALLVGVAAVIWGVLVVAADRGATMPPLTWTAPAGVALLAVVVLATWLGLRSRLRRPAQRPHPLSMARMAVLGKASAHVGPLVGGLYAGYLFYLLPGLEVPAKQQRAVICVVAVLATVALSAGGLLLERACRVPPADADALTPA